MNALDGELFTTHENRSIKMEAAERSIENKYSVLRAVRRGDVGQKPKSVRRGFRHSDFQILIIGEKR